MSVVDDPVLERFLTPAYAVDASPGEVWVQGELAQTPGEDARCRVFLRVDASGCLQAAFSAFGPPVVIACADWLCERVAGLPVEAAGCVSAREVEKALALMPTQRYAGLLAIDALERAIIILKSS